MISNNARRYPRVQLSTLVHCTTATGERIVAAGGNISCGGLFLPTAQPVEVGSELSLRFRLPYPGKTLSRSARVVWRRPPESEGGPAGVGVAFSEGDEADTSVISQYVESALKLLEPTA